MDLDSPPQVLTEVEENLTSSQMSIAKKGEETRRRIIEKLQGNFSSEHASYSDEFGFIFRYKLNVTETDTKSTPATYQITLWSRECEQYLISTQPSFTLKHIQPD